MWRPTSWDDLKALEGEAEESAHVDFKRELGSNHETAKDIAALTMDGGVLIYGLPESKETRRAGEATPIPINGLEEKIRSIAGTRIFPVPKFELGVIRAPDDDTLGVIVVTVPPSVQSPHWVDCRFPIRRGTTTEYLTEPEIERLYIQRHQSSVRPSTTQLSQEFHSGFDMQELQPLDRDESSFALGEARLLVRPLVPEAVVLPGGPWQGERLSEAVRDTFGRVGPALANPGVTSLLQKLHAWHAIGVGGWRAGDPPDTHHYGQAQTSASAAWMTYPGRLSFHMVWGLAVPSQLVPQPSHESVRSARELDVIREVALCLAVAGGYFAGVRGASILLCQLTLHGFDGAKSQTGLAPHSGAGPAIPGQLPDAPPILSTDATTSAMDLRDAPRVTTQALTELWLPPFYRDLYERSAFDIVFGSQPSDPTATS